MMLSPLCHPIPTQTTGAGFYTRLGAQFWVWMPSAQTTTTGRPAS